jgi:NADH:ubiquinone oxidoreductase subunit 6 (subunit J)
VSTTDVYIAIVFYVTAALMIAGALGMVLATNMVRSAILLTGTLSGVAVLYIALAADFLGIVQLLVYVGAIMILMLFAIMMTPRQVDLGATSATGQKIASLLTAVITGVIAVASVLSHPWAVRTTLTDAPTSEKIGALLLSSYVLPFEIASVLLTVAMIGAIVIARED